MGNWCCIQYCSKCGSDNLAKINACEVHQMSEGHYCIDCGMLEQEEGAAVKLCKHVWSY